MKKWLPILAFGFVLALLGNIFFTINGFERSRVVSVPDGDSLDLADGRQLAIVTVDLASRPGLEAMDPLLQRALVSAGLARNKSTASSDYNRVLADAQEIAKSNKLGIWSDACRGSTSGRDDCVIKGNIREGKKQY